MLLEIVLAIVAIFFILQLIFSRKENANKNKIPGMSPSDPEEGNRDEIKKAKNFFKFILNLHEKFGPIACFWEGKKMAVSVATPELFKETRHLFNVNMEAFKQFELLTGKEAMAFSKEDEIRRRRKIYSDHFMMKACKSYSKYFVEIAEESTRNWQNLKPNETFSLFETMSKLSITALARTSFGSYFEDEKNMTHFQALVDYTFRHMDPVPEEGTEEYETLKSKCEEIKSITKTIIEERRNHKRADDDRRLLIDSLIEDDFTEEERTADAIVFIAAGYLATAVMMTWFIYQMCRHPELQEKVHEETVKVLGDKPITIDVIPELRYIRQVFDETLRTNMKNGFGVRVADDEMKLGGYHIPKGTTIYHAMGTLFHDPNIWENPEKFDPDRFSPENSRGRHAFAFKPFGFAGKRNCIGQAFAYTEATLFLAQWFRHFRFRQEPEEEIKLMDSIFILPEKEIRIAVESRV